MTKQQSVSATMCNFAKHTLTKVTKKTSRRKFEAKISVCFSAGVYRRKTRLASQYKHTHKRATHTDITAFRGVHFWLCFPANGKTG